ncbi:MAG: hypothetical protein QM817_20665 [Archangium sp.]
MSEVVPVAPQPNVRAPLVMERLLQFCRDDDTRRDAEVLGDIASSLGPSWQNLVSCNFEGYDAQYILERFVGLTLRDLCAALRSQTRVLPLDVARSIAEVVLDAVAAMEGKPSSPDRPLPLTDRSIGLCINREWRFALGNLNHWLADYRRRLTADAPENSEPLSPDVMFFLSPEAFQARDETSASLATRAALFIWQLIATYHPYRGNRFEVFASVTRYNRNDVRVPLEVHPDVPKALVEVMKKGVRFSGDRFANLRELRAALDAAWPKPAAPANVVFQTVISAAWPTLQQQLHGLRREPMLPIRWDGVWDASRTPEEGLAVLEDQFLELLLPIDTFPKRLPAPPDAEDVPNDGDWQRVTLTPQPERARENIERLTLNLQREQPRRSFFSRLFASLLGR